MHLPMLKPTLRERLQLVQRAQVEVHDEQRSQSDLPTSLELQRWREPC
jgi:hypothetical protein